jgi:hypothetical protein
MLQVINMESKDSQSSSNSHYEPALGYVLEDIRPDGGVVKFRSPAYSNVSRRDRLRLADQTIWNSTRTWLYVV